MEKVSRWDKGRDDEDKVSSTLGKLLLSLLPNIVFDNRLISKNRQPTCVTNEQSVVDGININCSKRVLSLVGCRAIFLIHKTR